jgi:hypothetical protein
MKVYIAGPMRGVPGYNYDAFNAAAKRWRDAGHEVYNPAETDAVSGVSQHAPPEPMLVRALMITGLTNLASCNAIALLPGWESSRGVGAELGLALALDPPLWVFDAETMQPIDPIARLGSAMDDDEQTILQEAEKLVDGDRREAYGHPFDDYSRTATLWSQVLGHAVTVEQAIMCMICVKLSRECNRHGRDNLVDIAGYAACLDDVHAERARRARRAD